MAKKRKINYPRLAMVVLLFILVIALIVSLISHFTGTDEPEINEITPTPTATASAVPTETATAAPEEIVLPVSATDYAPIEIDNETGFESSWETSVSGSASADFTLAFDTKTITVTSSGSTTDVTLQKAGYTLIKDAAATFSFTASATNSQTVTVEVLNGNDASVLQTETFTLSSDERSYSFAITPEATYYNAMIRFSLGGTSNTITIKKTRLVLDYSKAAADVHADQVGYSVTEMKRATFASSQGDSFDVVNNATGEIVYTGAIVNKAYDIYTGETVGYGDFTNVMTAGTYYIRSESGYVSYTFTIGEHIYSDLQASLTHMLSLQRCGMDLDSAWAEVFSHSWCHSTWATIYESLQTKDVSGGWHDAADYGRYISTGAKAVSDLLIAYIDNPELFTDDTNSAESGNGIPDILDEARYELEWMMKMQYDNGSVASKVLTANVSGAADPSTDDQELYVLYVDTQATADVEAVMAIAQTVWADIDEDFATLCQKSAERANGYLLANYQSMTTSSNPEEINGGLYRDDEDVDERFYAVSAMYYATGDTSYLTYVKQFFEETEDQAGTSWRDVATFGKYLLLKSNLQEDDADFYETILNSLTEEADALLSTINANGYGVSLKEYAWGSNGFALNDAEVLLFAYEITGNKQYKAAAYEQVNYVLGRNSLGMCFVTTYGTNSPQNVHQYTSNALGVVYPGALVGGPDSSREDTVTAAMDETTPAAKVYADEFLSYSTNEVSVYWNSVLINVTSYFN